MWYSAKNKIPFALIGETKGRPIVLQKMNEILRDKGITIGRKGEYKLNFSTQSREFLRKLGKIISRREYKSYIPEQEKRAIRKAFSNVGLDDFHLHLMVEESNHLDIRASSPKEAKQKLLKNRKNIMKYCNTSFPSEENIIIEESSCKWLQKYS